MLAACQGPSVLICLPIPLPIPPIPMIFFSTFKSFFHPCSLACLHPFLKKAASCRESRHKLLTFPPPRNSRAILPPSLREGEKKAGKGRAYGDGCVSYGSRSLSLMGNKGISRRERESKDYGTIYRRRRPDLENHIKPYIYDYLWTSLSQEGRKREAILLTEAKWLL